MKAVLSISSQTVYGHVGNSAAQFVLQRLGFEVWAIPTILLSNHPGHTPPAKTTISTKDILDHVSKLASNGWLRSCVAVHSGYLADPSQIDAVAQAVGIVRRENSDAIYACDPIMGDQATGLYVSEGVADRVKTKLVPLADILTPNAFELAHITGQEIVDTDHALIAARQVVAPMVLCSSIPRSSGAIATAAINADHAYMVETPKIDNTPKGTGDVLAALYLAESLKGADSKHALRYAVGATYELCLRSAARMGDELPLIEEQDALLNPVKLQVTDLS